MIGSGRELRLFQHTIKVKGLLLLQQTPSQKGGHPMMQWLPVIGYALILAYYIHHNVGH